MENKTSYDYRDQYARLKEKIVQDKQDMKDSYARKQADLTGAVAKPSKKGVRTPKVPHK